MDAPYSLDLRERVVEAIEQGGMSRNQAARHFGVAISTAITWVMPDQLAHRRPAPAGVPLARPPTTSACPRTSWARPGTILLAFKMAQTGSISHRKIVAQAKALAADAKSEQAAQIPTESRGGRARRRMKK